MLQEGATSAPHIVSQERQVVGLLEREAGSARPADETVTIANELDQRFS